MKNTRRGKHFANPSTPTKQRHQQQQSGAGHRKKPSKALWVILIAFVLGAILFLLVPTEPKTVELFDVIDRDELSTTMDDIADGLAGCGNVKMKGTVEGNTVRMSFEFGDGVDPIVEYRVHQVIHDEANATSIRGALMNAADTASSQDEVLAEGASVLCDFQGPEENHIATATFTRDGLQYSNDKDVSITLEDVWNSVIADTDLQATANQQIETTKSELARSGIADFSMAAHGNEFEYVYFFDDNEYPIDSDIVYEHLHDEQLTKAMTGVAASFQQISDEMNLGITGITCRVTFQGINSGEVVGSCVYSVDGIVG